MPNKPLGSTGSQPGSGVQIIVAETPAHFAEARTLIANYLAFLQEDISFQHVDEELEQLQKWYGLPKSCLLLAMEDGTALGCIAVKNFSANVGEVKRLYLRPEARGRQLGKMLVAAIEEKALEMGYSGLLLDTLARLEPAVRLYKACGYAACAPYYHNPLAGVLFFRKSLVK